MAYNQYPKFKAHAQHYETVFILGMIGIEVTNGVFVQKNGLCFIKGYSVLFYICRILCFIPLKLYFNHMYIVNIVYLIVKLSNKRSNR